MSGNWGAAWITGASSGIGRELAVRLAGEGVSVAASARSADALNALADTHPRIGAYPVDVTDRTAMARTYERIEADLGPVDLAILNAGYWKIMGASDFDSAAVERTMAVNVVGYANTLEPALKSMLPRRRGHIAMVSSVAGYRGLPRSSAYGPSKAAIINMAETLRSECRAAGVSVSVINPGFVDTPMTAENTFPMPFMVGVEEAAEQILRGLRKGKFEIVFPWQMALSFKLARLLPYWLYFPLEKRLIKTD